MQARRNNGLLTFRQHFDMQHSAIAMFESEPDRYAVLTVVLRPQEKRKALAAPLSGTIRRQRVRYCLQNIWIVGVDVDRDQVSVAA
jgi:hypothetical protein